MQQCSNFYSLINWLAVTIQNIMVQTIVVLAFCIQWHQMCLSLFSLRACIESVDHKFRPELLALDVACH